MKISHSIELSGKSLESTAGKDLKVNKPILCRHFPTLDFDGTLSPIYRSTLIRDQVRQDRKTIEVDPLTAVSVVKPFHHKQLPVHRIVKLIYWRGRLWNVGIRKQNMPSWLLALYPFSHPHPVFFSPKMRHLFSKSPQSLRKRPAVRGFASFLDEKDLPKLPTKLLAYGFGHLFDLAG